MAITLMAPLILEVDSILQESDKKDAFDRLCSVYGPTYSKQKDLLSLLNLCVQDNKINPGNTLPLKECLASTKEKQNEIGAIVQRFEVENASAITEWEGSQPSEFIGRDIGRLGSILERFDGVILWGSSGVGKTKLARTYMASRLDFDTKVVDLRNVTSVEVMYVETLKQFNKFVSIEDASSSLVSYVITQHVEDHKSLLLFDNADDFVHHPGVGTDLTSEFASLVKDILLQPSPHNLKIIITSRSKSEHPDASLLYQEHLMSLNNEDASSIIKSRMIHEEDKDSTKNNEMVTKATRCCANLPLNLNVLAAALQERGNKLESILPIIKKKAKEWKEQKQKVQVELPEEDLYTHAVLASRFDQLSDIVQLAAVALSLFTRTFTLEAVTRVLKDYKHPKIHLIVNHLKSVRFLNDDGKSVYDMHPKVREFLIGTISSTDIINDFYVKAKENFIVYYKEQLTSISRLVDDDYLKAYDKYMEKSTDFDFIFHEKDKDLILVDDYDDNQNIISLLSGMIEPKRRLELYSNLAETAFNRGKIPLAAQHLCNTVLADSFFNPVETFDFTLLRAQHTLKRLEEERDYLSSDEHLDNLYGLYHFARGEVLYRMVRVNFSLADCEAAAKCLEKSIEIRKRLSQDGSTELIRSFVNLGNIYNITEDVHRKHQNFGETEKYLEMALDTYNQAREMRSRLSPNGPHIDLPQIESSIGTIWNERGLLLQILDRRAHRYGVNERALEHFREAETWFRQSLETEKKLKLDGLYQTSVKLVNLGDVQRYMKKREDAIETLNKALNIRKMFKGDHEDTVIVLYRLGTISMDMEEFKEAARYYKEAFEMDERLPENYHSAVRQEIRKYLVTAYKLWSSIDRTESERIGKERKDLEKKIESMEKQEKRSDEAAELEKGTSSGAEPPGDGMDPSGPSFQSNMASCDKYADGEFDKTGGHVSFRYANCSLTIPRNLTEDMQAIRIYCMKEEDVEIPLSASEFLVSSVIRVESRIKVVLTRPVLLEIRCDVLKSRVGKFFELSMIEYDPVSKTWADVEKKASLQKRFYWYDENDNVPIMLGWIKRFSKFAVVVRPKSKEISVPSAGLIWRPVEDGRISLQFPPGCFQNDNTKCTVKVVELEGTFARYASERFDLLLSPAISVQVKDSAKLPLRLSLPLFHKPPSGWLSWIWSRGVLRILKMEDSPKADFKVEDLKPNFEDEHNAVVEMEVTGFSWIMAVWSSSTDIAAESLKWVSDKMFRCFQYDVDIHLFKRTAVDDSVMIGVSCTSFKSSDLDWLQKLKNVKDSGYEYVNSAPASERLYDSALIRVEAKGQYVIPKSGIDSFRFNSRNFAPTPMALKENSSKREDRWIHFRKDDGDIKLCSIPYHKNFKLVSDNDSERAAYQRSKRIRFLGLRLDNCGLDCLNILHNYFRNNLHRMGLDEIFIDQLKLDTERTVIQSLVRELLNEITRLFVDGKLARGWFSVFEDYAHPESLKKDLINVMAILNKRLYTQNWHEIQAAIEDGSANSEFLSSLNSGLQTNDGESRLAFREAMIQYVDKGKYRLIDLVRRILKLKNDGYEDDVDKVLDKIGEIVESWMLS